MLIPSWLQWLRPRRRIHLDYASATPLRAEVRRAMEPYLLGVWANPSAIYTEGVFARRAIEDARTELARILHVRSTGVTFVSGGTEANNLALIGYVESLFREGRTASEIEIISTRLEHPSVIKTLEYLMEKRGVTVHYAEVDAEGVLASAAVEKLLSERTALVTLAYVNSETGVITDLRAVSRVIRKWNEAHDTNVVLHTDASQAPLWLSCELDRLGVDLMTLDAGKCYGPKGVGVLARRHGVHLLPIIHGGGQEGEVRSGTENTPLVIGCVCALVCAQESWKERSEKARALREYCFEKLARMIPEAVVNGSRERRVSNNVNVSLPGIDTEYAVIWLDTKGIAVSTKSACGIKGKDGSEVVRAMTGDGARARSTLRFTFGEETTKGDVDKALSVLKNHLEKVAKS